MQELLILLTILSLFYIIKEIKKDKLLHNDALYWILILGVILYIVIFPSLIDKYSYIFNYYAVAIILLLTIYLIFMMYKSNKKEKILKDRIDKLTEEIILLKEKKEKKEKL